MPTIVRMPEVMANATKAALVSWLKTTGESVTAGDEIAEIETEKALVSVIAEGSGTMARILVEPGQSVNVGAIIAVLTASGDTEADVDTILSGSGGVTEAAVELEETTAPDAPQSTSSTEPPARIFISPIARKLAKDLGLELSSLTGTGPGGRIVRRDVEAAEHTRGQAVPELPTEHDEVVAVGTTTSEATGEGIVVDSPNDKNVAAPTSGTSSTPASRPVSPASGAADYIELPHSGMRRAIARRLTESKSQVPHFYVTTECRVDDLLALRAQINLSSPRKISVNDLVVKAVAATLIEIPEANVTWTDTALRQYSSADVSIAVSTPGGLVTPVIRNASGRSLSNLSAEAAELAERGRNGRLRQDEIEGGSFSVTNLGMFGTSSFSAILNPPQSGILAVGAAQQKTVVIDGELAVATVMTCTLSADHRAIDGAVAARWLAAFTARIENPLSILI